MYSNLCLLFNTFFSVLRKKKRNKKVVIIFLLNFLHCPSINLLCVRFFITYNISFLNLKLMKHVERNLYCKG